MLSQSLELDDIGEHVLASAAGDQMAWETLVDRYAQTVWGIARGYQLTAAEASDVSQATWLHLVQALPSLDRPGLVGEWLATAAHQESVRFLEWVS